MTIKQAGGSEDKDVAQGSHVRIRSGAEDEVPKCAKPAALHSKANRGPISTRDISPLLAKASSDALNDGAPKEFFVHGVVRCLMNSTNVTGRLRE
jgi:hypothetical protein